MGKLYFLVQRIYRRKTKPNNKHIVTMCIQFRHNKCENKQYFRLECMKKRQVFTSKACLVFGHKGTCLRG